MSVTIWDVAREAGLSPSTVADVLRGRPGYSAETRRRTLEAARKLDFVPNYFARSLQVKRSYTVGIVGRLEDTMVTGPMLKAIVEGLNAKGYMSLFCESGGHSEGLRRAVREVRSRLVDGIILTAGADESELEELLPSGLPRVMISSDNSVRTPSVIADRFHALRNGVHWLAQRGHRRIAFLGADNEIAMRNPYNTHCLKIKGYRAAMEELGLWDEKLLLDGGSVPGMVREFVIQHADLFREITAVLAGNDRLAIEAMSGLTEIGVRVPEDCSIIGFDDTEFALAVRPRLTTFRPQRAEIGLKAVEMVLSLIEGKDVANVTFVPELIERESTAFCAR